MQAPVFIVGCPRSGTSFLYHLLLSAGGFAEFHTQMNVFDVLEPIYGDLRLLKNRKKLMREWLRSKAFRVSGLQAEEIEAKVLAECQNGSDFLRIVMGEIARKQAVDRWIDSTPTNLPHMLRIHEDFQDAKFVHLIRDGRDVALSLDRRGWSRPLPWDKENSLLAAGIYWEWIVRKGRKYGAALGANYTEMRYEDLVAQPMETLARLGAFLGCDIDYERIQRVSIGSVKNPLTSFSEELQAGRFSPVGRWREKFPKQQLVRFEGLVGTCLQELAYPLSAPASGGKRSWAIERMRFEYRVFYESKQWAKVNTPLSRWLVDYAEILIDK
jgi:LPS sulfotransferase NodH